MKTLAGKVAIITGASRGLGKAIAQLFSHEGAKVILSSRTKEVIEQNAADLRMEGMEAYAYACDVSDPIQVEGLAYFAFEKFGVFDIWINNAGISGPYGATLDLSPDQFLSVLRTNIFGVYHGSTIAMRHFLPRDSGKLINILGAGAKTPVPNQNAYGSTKAWIRVFTLALASEYRQSRVGVYALQPGLMDTDLLTDILTFESYQKRLDNFMPVLIRATGRNPQVPARKALWLASPATDGKTGLDIHVGSSLSFMIGFLREGLRSVFHLPSRPVNMKINIIPSAFKPLD
jgi:glucose 1-dehydrogenase